jgi:hypothetical protein
MPGMVGALEDVEAVLGIRRDRVDDPEHLAGRELGKVLKILVAVCVGANCVIAMSPICPSRVLLWSAASMAAMAAAGCRVVTGGEAEGNGRLTTNPHASCDMGVMVARLRPLHERVAARPTCRRPQRPRHGKQLAWFRERDAETARRGSAPQPVWTRDKYDSVSDLCMMTSRLGTHATTGGVNDARKGRSAL